MEGKYENVSVLKDAAILADQTPMTITATKKGMSNKGDANDPIVLSSEEEDVEFAPPRVKCKRPKQTILTPAKRQKPQSSISPAPPQ